MSKTNPSSPQTINTNYNGPTIQELEIIMSRIEELDAKLENKTVNSKGSKQAA